MELRGVRDAGLAFPVKRLAAALAAVTLIRLIVAAAVPLAPDETYYWVWSHALAFGYLDHPPMVALWIRIGTMLAGQTSLGVRLLGPLAAFVASLMLYDAARVLFASTKAAVAAVLLLNATLLIGAGSVVMTPDSPLLFFWTATLWAMAHIAAGGGGWWWLAAGAAGGLALDSKYTALLLWVGIGLWVLLVPAVRPWLRRWQPWAACATGFLLFVPVLAWNAVHDWAGFLKQGGRTADWDPVRAPGFLAELIAGQIGLATPLVWLLCMAGLWTAVRQAWRTREPAWSLLAALSAPPVLVFLQHAVGDRVQGNWPAIIYPALAIAAAARTSHGSLLYSARTAAALGFAIVALVYVQAATGAIPLPPRLDPIAMRLAGWDKLARQVRIFAASGDPAFIAAEGYALASELAWWMPPEILMTGTDDRWGLTTLPAARIAGQTGLLIRDVRRAGSPDPALWLQAERIGTVTRGIAAGAGFAVYRVTAASDMTRLPAR